MELNSPLDKGTDIGSVLLKMGVLTRDRLREAAQAQKTHSAEMRLGQILVAMGVITDVDLEYALRVQNALRQEDPLAAYTIIVHFQTERLARSVISSETTVDAILENETSLHSD